MLRNKTLWFNAVYLCLILSACMKLGAAMEAAPRQPQSGAVSCQISFYINECETCIRWITARSRHDHKVERWIDFS